jgi:GNAT superfamily N-acetyltransferase
VTVIARTAVDADFPAIAAISPRSDQYLQHLMSYGRLLVAGDPVLGFAGMLPVGGVAMLTDLFVDPDAQSAGTGSTLLDAVLDGWAERMTFSSQDPRAVSLYARAGMSARWPLFYLVGDASRLGREVTATPVPPERAGGWERRWTGVDRTPTYRMWSGQGAEPLLIGDPAAPVAVAAYSGPEVLPHVAVAPDATAGEAILDAVASAGGRVRLYLPGPHPAVEPLLRSGFHIDDFDLFMTTGPDTVATGAYEPGLY